LFEAARHQTSAPPPNEKNDRKKLDAAKAKADAAGNEGRSQVAYDKVLDEYERARSQGLHLHPKLIEERYPAPYFVDYVKHQILTSRRFGQSYSQRYNFLFRGGLNIYTTVDLRMQRAAEAAVHGILSQPGDPYGAMTAVDPRNGHIKAMVGGRDFAATQGRICQTLPCLVRRLAANDRDQLEAVGFPYRVGDQVRIRTEEGGDAIV
jgi:membrane carboxypeptidase/penicillin-binding protein PbpC